MLQADNYSLTRAVRTIPRPRRKLDVLIPPHNRRRRYPLLDADGLTPSIGILVGEPTEPERTGEQSQLLTQEMEIVLNLARFHSNTRLLLQAARGARSW